VPYGCRDIQPNELRSVVVLPVESDGDDISYKSVQHATWRVPTHTMHTRTYSNTNACTHGVANGIAYSCPINGSNARSNGLAYLCTNVLSNSSTNISTDSSTHGTHSNTLCGANTPSHRVANPSTNRNTHNCCADVGTNRSTNQRAIDSLSNGDFGQSCGWRWWRWRWDDYHHCRRGWCRCDC
jgi:hypothetical protein